MSLVGRQIGRYQILEQLGSGGMSVVYKGMDTALEREVAVKVLHPHLAGKEESRRRLAREAKAVAKLRHPNIVEVFDFSTLDASDAYIVTEYIRGPTLRAFCEAQKFYPPELAAMAVHELAAALAHAHEAGVIHRDLKPENVMVRDDGVLKLMDFGIAKIVDRDEKMTMTGALVGSPAHMAPEIIEGEEAGLEADVFSLGTILYLLATGRLPFTAPNTTATLKRILDGQYEDPRSLCPAVSDELAEIIAQCLARNPKSRFADGGKLRDALARCLEGVGLTHAGEELSRFFAAPDEYRARLAPRLADSLAARAEKYRAEKRPARALSCLNQALALQPEHPRAVGLLAEIRAAKRREQRRAALLKVCFGTIVCAAMIAGAWEAWNARPGPIATAQPAAGSPHPADSTSAPEDPTPAPKSGTPGTTPAANSHPPRPKLVPVTLRVRPFGYVQIDSEPRSAQALQQHELKLAAGKHLVRLTCDLGCDETSKEITVTAAGPNVESLAVTLKPARLTFDYQPDDAMVKIGKDVRSVRETRVHPFLVESAEGPKKLQHQVDYEISRAGYRTVARTEWVPAGKLTTLQGKLERE